MDKTCPFIPSRMLKADGTCGRYEFCDDERHSVCGARRPRSNIAKPYSRRKDETGKGCPHKITETKPTNDRVIIDGEEKTVFEVVCKECGHIRRMIL